MARFLNGNFMAEFHLALKKKNNKEDEEQNPITGMKVAECLNPANIWKPTQA